MKGYAVQFKTDCPHVAASNTSQITLGQLSGLSDRLKVSTKCNENNCEEENENWVCVTCLDYFCSRYVNEHAVDHFQSTDHPIGLSMFDLSFWCYKCNRYIKDPKLTIFRDVLYKSKFGQ